MANAKFYKAMERIAKFREEKEKKGKKKVSKATKPISEHSPISHYRLMLMSYSPQDPRLPGQNCA